MEKDKNENRDQNNRGVQDDPRKTDFEKSKLENDTRLTQSEDHPLEGNKNPNTNNQRNEAPAKYDPNKDINPKDRSTNQGKDPVTNDDGNQDILESETNRNERNPNRSSDPQNFEEHPEEDFDNNVTSEKEKKNKNEGRYAGNSNL